MEYKGGKWCLASISFISKIIGVRKDKITELPLPFCPLMLSVAGKLLSSLLGEMVTAALAISAP
jgi:hypothetical protein